MWVTISVSCHQHHVGSGLLCSGAIAISDIVGRLRSRNYPAGAIVTRRGGPGDSMYFIVSGEVEIRIGARPVRLRDGAFFGEMALLDRRPRSTDVVTVAPFTLLTLNVADFYQIAGQQPSLVAAIDCRHHVRADELADTDDLCTRCHEPLLRRTSDVGERLL